MTKIQRLLISQVRVLLLAALVVLGPMLSAGQAEDTEPTSVLVSEAISTESVLCEIFDGHSHLGASCQTGSSCQVHVVAISFLSPEFSSAAVGVTFHGVSSRDIKIAPNPQPPRHASRI